MIEVNFLPFATELFWLTSGMFVGLWVGVFLCSRQ